MSTAKTKITSRKTPVVSRKSRARLVGMPQALPPITATVSSKGQIVIPAKLRRKYRLEEGVTVVFREEDGHLMLEPDRFAALLAFRGSLPAQAEALLIEDKKREREREDRER